MCANQPPNRNRIVRTKIYQNLVTRVNSRISNLALAEKVWLISHGHGSAAQQTYAFSSQMWHYLRGKTDIGSRLFRVFTEALELLKVGRIFFSNHLLSVWGFFVLFFTHNKWRGSTLKLLNVNALLNNVFTLSAFLYFFVFHAF